MGTPSYRGQLPRRIVTRSWWVPTPMTSNAVSNSLVDDVVRLPELVVDERGLPRATLHEERRRFRHRLAGIWM